MMAFGKAYGGGRREGGREAAPLTVLLTTVSRSYSAQLIDLSATGARLRCDDLPAIGVELDMMAGRIKTFCTVRWASDSEFGVQFFDPLPQADGISVRREVAAGMGLDPSLRAAMDDWVLGVAR
jgi:hypothetical protein